MAKSTTSTRKSQWRVYLRFCEEFELVPLPASLDTILLYITYLANSYAYVSIIHYLSAVWSLHKLNGFEHVEPSSFLIQITLKGIRRVLGDVSTRARPIMTSELLKIFELLDCSNTEDLAYWVALLLCFRGLLHKSNVVEPDMAVCVKDIGFFIW